MTSATRSQIRACHRPTLIVGLTMVVLLMLAGQASGAPLPGSAYDSGDGNQDTQLSGDWQSAQAQGRVKISRDRNDDCFIGGVKELSPDGWAFNNSAGGCTPGKSNIRVAYVNAETLASTSYSHFAFFRNDTTGNTFLTFELNQTPNTWVNGKGTTIPCRSNGDILLSFEVGGSSLQSVLYRWTGDNSGPPSCPNGANGTFTGSGVIPGSRSQGTMNSAQAITNYVDPASFGASFPANSFGEAAIDIPAVLQAMGQSPCVAFLQMQVHSRSSSSISSAMIDYTEPVPVNIQSCAAIGEKYADVNANGARDGGENGLGGFEFYDDSDDDGVRDAGEPTGTSDASGFYRILDLAAGVHKIRELPKAGWRISEPVAGFYQRSLTTGGNSVGNDFGNVGPATATGTRFHDLDNDGVRDAGELGQAGWTFYADLDGDGVKDAGEPAGSSDAGGAWTIDNVPAGAFTIREVPQGGWSCSAPAGCAYARTFVSGATVSGLEFGGWTPASVAGNVFEDLDGDGAALEAGDVALSGWQVYLDANASNAWDLGEIQTTTDVSGNYTLTGVPPGAYAVRVTSPPSGWYCTRPANTAATCERALTLTSGQLAGGQDFGFTRTATVSGTVFNDADNSGTRGGAETAWTTATTIFADLNANGALDAGEPSVSTSTGSWTLGGIPAGAVAIRQVSGAFTCTTPVNCGFGLTPTSGQTLSGLQFGNYVNSANGISGTIWLDANANNAKDAGETTGVAGITVYADNDKSGGFNAGDTTGVTNSAGAYVLTTTANGNVPVRIKPDTLGVYICSFPAGCSISVSGLGNGKSFPGTDFGVYGPAAVSGRLVDDANANGVDDAGETTGLAGRTIYDDANNNLAFDSATETNTTTAADGTYTLPNLNPGLHRIRMVTGASYSCSAPSGCVQVVTLASANMSGLDFLNWTPATITGTVFEDADADGAAREGGEAALPGRTVYLDTNNNSVKDGVEPSVVTGVSGIYTFSAVVPGSQTVRQVLPAGWVQDMPAGAYTVVAGSGSTYSGRDFSSHTSATISGRVFDDADFQGDAFETGDTGMAGRTVYLDTNANGQLDGGETTVVTDGSGNYTLTVAPASYSVRTVPANADRACASPSGCAYSITATSGTTYASRDFGSYVGATVSGSVFEDADADGQAREAGEPPAPGRRVYLDANADGVRQASEPTTLTAADGSYSFRGVTAQSWGVRLELGGGWTCDSPSLPCAYAVVLTSGATQSGKDFGVHTTATISGHLYTDRDNDGGPQVFGENDQPERTVYLDANASGALDGAETQTVTDDLGNYSFASLQPGSYRIRQVLPAGWQSSVPASGLRTVTVVSGETKPAQDFSSWTTAVITGRVFEDTDADGQFPEAGEPGMPLRTVYLDTDADGSFDGGEPSAITGAGGSFTFTGLAPGTYTVRPVVPDATWTCSHPASCVVQLVVEAGEVAQEINFGLWTSGTLSGTVFDDTNGDGDRDGGEGPLANRIVFVDLDGDTSKGAGEPSQATDAGGGYAFHLQPGTYTVRETPPAGWVCTTSPCAHAATIGSGQTAGALDFGNRFTAATVSGTVFDDADADGAAREAGEAPRSGRTVYDDVNDSHAADAGEPQTTSGADGSYTLQLAAGVQHTIRVEEAGRTVSHPAAGEYTFTPAIAELVGGRDFGSYADATITGSAYIDSDNNAARNGGEPAAPGVVIYADIDGDGGRDPGEPFATTDATGAYTLGGVRPGAVHIRGELAPSFACSTPAGCDHPVNPTSGATVANRDFGLVQAATATGRVAIDADGSGTAAAGEPPLAGWTVYVDLDGDGQLDAGEPSAVTIADGTYSLANVTPGTRTLRVDAPAGWTCSSPCSRSVALQSGTTSPNLDFAVYQPASIAGRVYEDDDANAARDPGEAGLAGRTVYVDVDGDGVLDSGEPTDITDAAGDYAFTGLAPGSYVVRAAGEPGWVCTDCSATHVLSSGEDVVDDFGRYAPITIAGTLYEDLDGDGTRDAGEPGLSGRPVFFDADDDNVADAGEPATLSGAGGAYSLSGVAPDAGTIRGSLPAGYVRTQPATDGYAVTLSSSDALTGRDFGGYRPGSIAGHVADDTNGNGVDDPGEPGKANWTMYLDSDDDGMQDPGEPTSVTNPAGDYDFGNLAPATYRVRPVVTAGFTCTKPALCVYVNALVSGEDATARDFALVEAARVSGAVYADADADGVRDPGDSGRPGRIVYVDYDNDGTLDPAEPFATSDAGGNYAIVGVSPGTFAVRYDAPAGEHISDPAADHHVVTFGSGAVVAAKDFGSYVDATIAGAVYDDKDDSGSRQAGENGLANKTVGLDAGADGSIETTTTTDAGGAYAFAGLTPGSYRVTVVAGAGNVCSGPSPCRWDRIVTAGASSAGNDFAVYHVPVADLSLVKSAPASVDQGQTFDYTLVVTNNGPDAAQSVGISDSLPGGVQFVSASGGCTYDAPPTVSCPVGAIANGASATRTITVRAIDAGAIGNTASVSSPTGDPSPANDSDDAGVTVAPVADVSMNKSGPADVAAGDAATYTLTAHNAGPSTATGVVLRDTLPSGLTFDAAASDAGWSEVSAGVYELTIASIANGASASRELVATAEQAAADSTQTNAATVRADQTDPSPDNDSDSAATDVGPSADLEITKTVADATIAQGQTAVYTLTLTNNGPSAASSVELGDDLPAGVTFVSLAAPAGFGCTTPAVGATGLVTCTAATLADGAVATFTLTVRAADVGTQSNTAEISSETPDPGETDNADSVDVDVAPAADVSLTKTGPQGVEAGAEATYVLTVSNQGPSTAHGVVVSDPLPAGLTFVSLAAGPGASCTTPAVGSGGTISCTIATLADGAGVELTLVARAAFATAEQTLVNTAHAAGDEFDPDAEDDDASAATAVGPAADLRLVKTASVAALPQNGQLTYTLTAFDDGPSDATNVSIADALPAGMSFVSASAGCAESAGTVTCDLGNVADGASRAVTITVKAVANGTQVNTATVSSDDPDPDPSDNPASATVEVGPTADLGIVKTGAANVAAGGQLTYTLTAHNEGPSTATGVRVVDDLPDGMTYLSSSASQGSCSYAAGTVTCALGSLADEADATVTLTVRATFALAGTTVPNSATISGDQNDGDVEDDASTHAVAVGPAADLVVTNDAPAHVPAGGQLLYTLQLANHGPQTAASAVLTDTLPAGLTFVSADPSQGSCSAAGQTVTCMIGTLPDGAAAQVLLTVAVANQLGGQAVGSHAVAASDTTDVDPSSNSDDASTVVDAAAVAAPPTAAAAAEPQAVAGDLQVTKTADKGAKSVLGRSVAFTIRVVNASQRVAHGVVVTDSPSAAATVGSVRPDKGSCSGLSCRLGDLAPGEVVLIHVVMTPRQAGTFRNSVVVRSDDGDRDEADNRADAAVKVAARRTTLSLRKVVDKPSVRAGKTVWFTITARNVGFETASNVRVCDAPAFNTTFVMAKGATFTRGRPCWTIASLAAGERVSYRVKVRVSGTTRRSATTKATVTASNAGSARARKTVRVVAGGVSPDAGVTG